MLDVDCAVGHAPCLTPSFASGYEVEEAEIIYWGLCPDCRLESMSAGGKSNPETRGIVHD
jgi:Fur family ferric uptake transcriptional regulator